MARRRIIGDIKIKIVVVFGTRPEAIKLSPVVAALNQSPNKFQVKIIITGQHKQLIDRSLPIFNLKPDYDLNIMIPNQSLFYLNNSILRELEKIFIKETPNMVLVHGDTPSAFAGALSAFYSKIPVAHVEAGLRTYNKYNPFPEEVNRQLIDTIADLYFAPTQNARLNLIKEGKEDKKIYVTGNTAIDAAMSVNKKFTGFSNAFLRNLNFNKSRIIFMTCHRRESWGNTLAGLFNGIRLIAEKHPDIIIVFPVHLNPKIRGPAESVFKNIKNIVLLRPLTYQDSIGLIKNSFMILTDSGGIQEEGAYFKIPTLVLRDVTERPEGVKSGALKVVGTDGVKVYKEVSQILADEKLYTAMTKAKNPFGIGRASIKIRKVIENYFNL